MANAGELKRQNEMDNLNLLRQQVIEQAAMIEKFVPYTTMEGAVARARFLQEKLWEYEVLVERLREAIDKRLESDSNIPFLREYMLEISDMTPSQSLTAHDNAVRVETIEECAVLADSNFNKVYDGDYLYEIDIANAIRNMARKYEREGDDYV